MLLPTHLLLLLLSTLARAEFKYTSVIRGTAVGIRGTHLQLVQVGNVRNWKYDEEVVLAESPTIMSSTEDLPSFSFGEVDLLPASLARLSVQDAAESSTAMMPNPKSPSAILALGTMAYNSYYAPDDKDWVDLPGWSRGGGFGSGRNSIRGHVYVSDQEEYDREVVVVVIKGTSLSSYFGGDGETATNDKLNDNMMFSCCCAKADWTFTPVCGCGSSGNFCDSVCLGESSNFKDSYYNLAVTIVMAVQELYPRASITVAGHSLGGALASLVALTLDLPAFTFQAPGERSFAKRLGLVPDLPETLLEKWSESLPIFAFGNDLDPIFLGTCRGPTSSCWHGGFAIETKCRLGKECVYQSKHDGTTPPPPYTPRIALVDTESINDHSIKRVIDRYLKKWRFVPECSVNQLSPNCTDCAWWTYK